LRIVRATMKTRVGIVLAIAFFLAAAHAIDTRYKTRVITSATLTIKVPDHRFITIRSFTQDKDIGQRGFVTAGIFPTPTPTPSPTATPTLSTNAGPGVAISTGAKLTDTATLFGDNNPTGTITFTLRNPSNAIVDTETIAVSSGNNTYGTPNGFSPTATGTYTWSALYSGDSNNNPATDNGQNESEIVTATPTPPPTPTPTATPISAAVLTAAITNASHAEFINPIIIAGPATLTIDPVPGATLSITYRKSLQPIQPTPTPTPVIIISSTVTPTPTPTSTVAAMSAVIGGSTVLIDDDSETPTPTATSQPMKTALTLTPTPTPTAVVTSNTATPTPTPTATM
jgi:hypothetical protein